MGQTDLFVNFFVALFALIDPIGNVPVFAAATSGANASQRRLISVYIGLFILGFLTIFYFTGLSLLEFFGISLPAFRIAGGIILFLLGLDMARDDFTAKFADAADEADLSTRGYARKRFEKLIVPFAMPLLIGPGAISTVVIFASDAQPLGLTGMAGGIASIAAVSLVVVLTFWATPIISKLLGRIGMTIVVRVLGLILCAMAVQFIIAGVGDATRGIIRPAAAAPYAAGH
ncbi:MAG: MarC family protein [Caulobacterales bacterium]|nr:MarC family protein [Caulobacterales bacterium]